MHLDLCYPAGDWHRDAAIQVLMLALSPALSPLAAAIELEQQLWEDHRGKGGWVCWVPCCATEPPNNCSAVHLAWRGKGWYASHGSTA
jgi:hypothetical protein